MTKPKTKRVKGNIKLLGDAIMYLASCIETGERKGVLKETYLILENKLPNKKR